MKNGLFWKTIALSITTAFLLYRVRGAAACGNGRPGAEQEMNDALLT